MLHAGEMLGTQCNTPGVPQPHSTNETSIKSLLPFVRCKSFSQVKRLARDQIASVLTSRCSCLANLTKTTMTCVLFRQYIMHQCLIVESNPYSLP